MVREFYNNAKIVLGQDIIYFYDGEEFEVKESYGLIADEGDCVFDNLAFVKELNQFTVLYFFSASYTNFHIHASNAIAHLPILNLSKNMREVAKEEVIRCKRKDLLLGRILKEALERSVKSPLVLLLT